MKSKKKKVKIILILVGIYLLIIVGLLCREKLLHINPQLQQKTDNEQTQQIQPTYDYDTANQKAKSQISYDMDKAPMQITKTDCASIIDANQLPSLERMEKNDSEQLMGQLQVLEKINKLGIDTKSFETPELNWKNCYNTVTEQFQNEHTYANQVVFYGSTASALNDFIKQHENSYITLATDHLVLDQTIEMQSNTGLNGNDVKFEAGNQQIDKAIAIRNCNNVALKNIDLEQGGYQYGVYVINSNLFSIEHCIFKNAVYKGLVVMGQNTGLIIKNNEIAENGNGAVFLDGNISNGIIEENNIHENHGTRNLTAGLVMSSMPIDDYETAYNEFKDEHLYELTNTPHDIVIRENNVNTNDSSGIYSDGAYQIYVVDNTIMGNDKEGMCLDYGTFGAYVGHNIIKENGGRRRQSDEDLNADFVTSFGRLADGSSPAKLPGISVDNSAYNTILNNTVNENYGSGIKMVRSSYRNIIMQNTVADNDRGRNADFHFFGIELGHASTPDEPVVGLDFTPDYENIICRNVISGIHYAGVFLAEDSYCNDIFDNIVMNAENFSIENHSQKFNSILNNTCNQKNLGL